MPIVWVGTPGDPNPKEISSLCICFLEVDDIIQSNSSVLFASTVEYCLFASVLDIVAGWFYDIFFQSMNICCFFFCLNRMVNCTYFCYIYFMCAWFGWCLHLGDYSNSGWTCSVHFIIFNLLLHWIKSCCILLFADWLTLLPSVLSNFALILQTKSFSNISMRCVVMFCEVLNRCTYTYNWSVGSQYFQDDALLTYFFPIV